MNKTFSKWEIATIKRTAQSVNPTVTKKNKLKAQIEKLQAEYDQLSLMQEQYEAPIKTMTGGFGTEDLVKKVVEDVGVDKNGNPLKATKYVLLYPETIVPPTENTQEAPVEEEETEENYANEEESVDTEEDTEADPLF